MKHLTEMQPLQRDLSLCPECGDPEKETVLRFGAWVLCAECSHEAMVFLGNPCTEEAPCQLCREAERERFGAYAASLEDDFANRGGDLDPWCLGCDRLRDDDNSNYCVDCRNRLSVNLGAEGWQASGILPGESPHAAPRTRWRSRSKFARPYICFLISFKRLICPST